MNKKDKRKKLNIVSKVLSYVCLIILLFVTLFLSFYFITNTIAKIKGKKPFVSIYTIVSPSMEPIINVYDVIVDVSVKNDQDLKVGDIVTFYSDNINTGGYTVTHRIVEIEEENGYRKYYTKGDNNQRNDDGYILFDDIVGRVVFKIPLLGRLQFFVSSKIGWLLIVLIPASIMVISNLFKIKKVYKIKKDKEAVPLQKEVEVIREDEYNKKLKSIAEEAHNIKRE